MQATVVSRMLEQVGLSVELQMLDAATYTAKTNPGRLDQPPEQQPWDIALRSAVDVTGATASTFHGQTPVPVHGFAGPRWRHQYPR